MTSGELLLAMAAEGEADWEVVRIEYTMVVGRSSMRFMSVSGHGAIAKLATPKRHRVSEDAFLGWLRMTDRTIRQPKKGPSSQSSSTPQPSPLPTSSSAARAEALSLAAEAGQLADDGQEDFEGDAYDANLSEDLLVGRDTRSAE